MGFRVLAPHRALHQLLLAASGPRVGGEISDLAAIRLAEHYARTAVLVFGILGPEYDLGRLRTTIRAVAPGAKAALGAN